MKVMYKIILFRLSLGVYLYLLLCLIGESFNPDKWNDAIKFMSIALWFGYVIQLLKPINKNYETR